METGNASIGRSLVLILFTGLRLGETVGLMWDDIDFQKRTFKVQRTLEYVKNRDGDESSNHYVLVEGTTKSISSERTIPLNQTTLNALLELKKANGGFAYVFSNAKGKPINPCNLNRAHDCILERAGISHIGIHALRYTFASQLFANKVDIKVISKLLGHSDVSVTCNIYIHLMQEELPTLLPAWIVYWTQYKNTPDRARDLSGVFSSQNLIGYFRVCTTPFISIQSFYISFTKVYPIRLTPSPVVHSPYSVTAYPHFLYRF